MLENGLASQVIIQILTKQMSLDPQRIWIRDQNRLIPNDDGMFVIVGMVRSESMLGASTMSQEDDQQIETVRINQREIIQIDVVSRSTEAILRNWEVLAALNSIYSKQAQEANAFKIFRLPHLFMNASGAEGGSTLNRYTINFACFTWYTQRRVLTADGGDYYDDFRTRVDDAQTIGTDDPLIEFEIPENSLDSRQQIVVETAADLIVTT